MLLPNFRGSPGYGEPFFRAHHRDWGGGDYRDIMAGVNAVVRRGIADSTKLAVRGVSFGGYMTAWIVSQTSRFKAAVMGVGATNLVSHYGTSSQPHHTSGYFGGPPSSERMPLYVARSPLTHVDSVRTPLLIWHGIEDPGVAVGQALEFYRALKDRGKTVELVLYPREGHGLTEYTHQRDFVRREYEWISKHTLGTERATTTP